MEYTQYSKQCTQKPLSIASWTDTAKECDIEEERFEIQSHKVELSLKVSKFLWHACKLAI